MAASLRTFGGRFADAPIVAVQPRRGVALSRKTLQALDQYNVTLKHEPSANLHPWFSFFNKLAALRVASNVIETDTVCWLDSDILVLDEPKLLALGPNEDFAACPSDNCGSSTGPDDKNDAYWKLVVTLAELNWYDYPWLTNCQGTRVRTYFNSGVFVYRRGRGFLDRYLTTCERLLFSGYKSPVTGLFFTDQVALGASALAAKLRVRSLPLPYNYPVGAVTEQPYSSERMAQAVVMHYHAALCADYYPTMLEQLRRDRPEAAQWLETWGPVLGTTGPVQRVVRKILKEVRGRKCRRYVERCQEIHADMTAV